MIPTYDIAKWQKLAPCKDYLLVEQNFIIFGFSVKFFSDEYFSETLAFNGGTALYKFYLNPA